MKAIQRFWKRLSITKKVFLTTTLVITVFLIISVVGQTLFYEKIYTYQKKEGLIHTVEEFSEAYSSLTEDNAIRQSITEYSNSANAYIMVLDETGNIRYTVSYEMQVETQEDGPVRLSLDNLIRNQVFLSLDLAAGDQVAVDYLFIRGGEGENVYIPLKISSAKGVWQEERNHKNGDFFGRRKGEPGPEEPAPPEATVKTALGTISAITLPAPENSNTMLRADAAMAAFGWINQSSNGPQSLEPGQEMHYAYQSVETGERYMIVVRKLANSQLVFAVTSLRSVAEAVNVMKNFYVPWFAMAILLSLLVATVFSLLVTRPVINITQVTTKMKDLDFSEKCKVSHEDEMGRLARNVNEMSDRLDSTIAQLLSANAKLKDDIFKERQLEQQRREFVATVSHELKTPLAIIRAYAEGLIDGVSVEKRERYMSVIVDETKKMDALVLDMLENSKLESGAEKLILKSCDLGKLMRDLLKLLEENCQQKGVSVRVEGTGGQAVCDRAKLEQVLTNFLSNALRHTPEGGEIRVGVWEEEADVYIFVENEGRQIPEKELAKVWDRFYKGDKARDRAVGGTGLGLSIAKNILILHHARYGVENTQTGVRFWFRLNKETEIAS